MKLALVLTLLSSLVLTACGGEGEPKTRVIGKNSPTECAYQPADGGAALMSNAGRKDYVKSDYFDKSYNRFDLEAIVGASGKETAKYAKAIDIELYRIPYNGSEDRCLYQENSIDVAPQSVLDWWKSRYNGRLNNGRAGVDGLYTMTEIAGRYVQLILVRTSSQRWTLVHELMHANFDSTREALGLPWGYGETAMAKTRVEIVDSLNAFNNTRTEANLLVAVAAYKKLTEQLKVTLINSPLEEIADESLLVNEFAAGRLKNVDRLDLINASWYINCSREKALVPAKELSAEILSTLENTALSSGFSTALSNARALRSDLALLDQKALELATFAKTVSGASDEQFSCNTNDRVVQDRLASQNPHLVNLIDNNPGLLAFKTTMREIRAAKAKIRAENNAGR